MWWKTFGWVVVLGMLLPTAARAQFEPGDWELTLGGSGGSDNDFETNNFTVNGSLGYFFTENLEVVYRQGVTLADVPGSDNGYAASSRVAVDWHFDLDRFQPFIGAQIGYVYGDIVNDTFVAGPEAGLKFFVNSTTFLYGMVEYQFFFEDGDDADDAFDDGQWVYGLGIGFRW